MKKIKTINNIVMRKKIKTKKNKRYRKNKTFKLGGAVSPSVSPVVTPSVSPGISSNDNSLDELTQKIKAEHSLDNFLPDFSLGDSHVLKKIIELSEGLMIKTIDNTAQFFNVDLNDSEQFKQRLEELKIILNDPKNRELMRELVVNFSEVGIVALDAASPFIDKLIIELFEKLTVMGNEFGKAGVKIALNTLGEIPGYGIIVGTVRSVNNAGEAVLASSNAASEIITVASDTANASAQNFDKLLKEKGDLINRTSDSINQFSENMKTIPTATGGSRKHNKTKKVRFNV